MNARRMTLGVLGMMGMAAGLLGCAMETTSETAGDEPTTTTPDEGRDQPTGESTIYGSGASGDLSYGGGKLLESVDVNTLYWGSNVANQSSLEDFYSMIVDSSYMGIVAEYATSSYPITRGQHGVSVTVASGPTDGVTDSDIRAELETLITAGTLPAPGSNSLYMVHLPPGVNAYDSNGAKSCTVWCGYHYSYTRANGSAVYYAVVVDMNNNGCSKGCGYNKDDCGVTGCDYGSSLDRTTAVASHELAEAVTDPNGSNGWYASHGEEIADLCNRNTHSYHGYRVQRLWSNYSGACTIVPPDFSLGISNGIVSIPRGSSRPVVVTTADTQRWAEPITLSVSGLPSGVTATPTTVNAGDGAAVMLTVSSSATPGNYAFTVTGDAPSGTHAGGSGILMILP